ncbi:MAG: hypothetical protein R3E68_10610 [Burkholderiaceae bacterium]
MSVLNVVKAALPRVGIMFVFLILVTYVPILSTWLPTLMMGPEIIIKPAAWPIGRRLGPARAGAC